MSLVERLRRACPAGPAPDRAVRLTATAPPFGQRSSEQLVRALQRQIDRLERAPQLGPLRVLTRPPEPFSPPDTPAATTPALVADGALSERLTALAALAASSPPPRGAPPIAAEELLFLDTETTGLARSAGTVVFLIGVGGFWGPGGSLAIEQLFVEHPEREAEVLRRLAPYLARARLLVTYNGGSFDLPLLRLRAALHREPLALAQPHLDLLSLCRYHLAHRLTDCRLVTVERELLGRERAHDIDGADVPALYADFLRHGQRNGIQRIAEHNHRDVGSLALLLERLTRQLLDPLQWAEDAAELCTTGARHLRRGDPALGERCLQRALASRLPGHLRHRATVALAAHLRRSGRSAALAPLWEQYRQELPHSSIGYVALAKYHEHVTGDLAGALALVRAAPGLTTGDPALLRRLYRLQRKLSLNDPAGTSELE